MYKMYLISAEGYENAKCSLFTTKNGKIWASMKDVKIGMSVKNMSDLILKEIYGICETENPTEEQVKEYKMTKREYYRRFDNLSKKELDKDNNKEVYVRNDVMTNVGAVTKQEMDLEINY